MKVIFDMDGTLNVWEKDTPMEKVSAPGYMRYRRPHSNVIEAARLLKQAGAEIFILSAVLPFPHAVPDKHIWLDRTAPCFEWKNRLFVPCGSEKSKALKAIGAGFGDVFVDDYNVNLREVQKHMGAKVACVKCVCPGTNDTHRSWDGARVYVGDRPEMIAASILKVGTFMKKVQYA